MSDTTNVLVAAGVLFVGYEAFRFLAVKQMNFSLASVDASQNSLTTNVSLGIKVDNPTQWSNTIDGLQGDIYANDKYLGEASIQGPIEIPAHIASVIPVGFKISDLALLGLVMSIITGGLPKATVTFRGRAAVNGLPFNFPLNLTYAVI